MPTFSWIFFIILIRLSALFAMLCTSLIFRFSGSKFSTADMGFMELDAGANGLRGRSWLVRACFDLSVVRDGYGRCGRIRFWP